jgi:uncharacterized protein YjbI with pentapeptide repeats
MANPEHVELLKQGVEVWNEWIQENPNVVPDLSGADLSYAKLAKARLSEANLENANLKEANLSGADLERAHLSGTDLSMANLNYAFLEDADLSMTILVRSKFRKAYLKQANLQGANITITALRESCLEGANLSRANLSWSNLSNANLEGANLSFANLTSTKLTGANLKSANLSFANLRSTGLENAQLNLADVSSAKISDCHIFGISAWGTNLKNASEQKNLKITLPQEPAIYVDNLEVAQFIYLLLHNPNIRGVIDTIGEKGVLILGRFTPERKAVLDAIRDKLRELGFVPMMFDFEKPTQRDFTETIKTLAGMSRFIIADITNPKSAPLELQAILPHYMIPLVPILQKGEEPFAMFSDLDQKYRQWVLPLLKYDKPEKLIMGMEKAIIKPARLLASKLQVIKAQKREARDIDDYL